MTTKEIYVPPTSDDFEVGDRLYNYLGFQEAELGTVHSVHNDYLTVIMDNGSTCKAPLEDFNEDNPQWAWEKLIDLNNIQMGSILSQKDYTGKRMFAKVVSIDPGSSVIAEYISGVTPSKIGKPINFIGADTNRKASLERKLLGWSLEG